MSVTFRGRHTRISHGNHVSWHGAVFGEFGL